jgi:hypothetical protein
MSGASMRLVVLVAICAVIGGCAEERQPESLETVAAFEVALPSEQDRKEFLSVLDAAAKLEGMHVDSVDGAELGREANFNQAFKQTMNAAVWRGANDEELIASAMDRFDHLGRTWLMCLRGKDPAMATRFRKRAMREIMLRWPGTLTLPIMPSGTIPVVSDLVRTPTGYVVKPSEAHKYEKVAAEAQPH